MDMEKVNNMEPGQMITYMDLFRNKNSGLPRKIRVSTIYKPLSWNGCWETLVFDQKEIKSYNGGIHNRIINNYHTKTKPMRQHRYAVERCQFFGYKVVEHLDNYAVWDKRLDIPALDLFGKVSNKEWNRLEFLRYLRENGKIHEEVF